jgi:hypothetical protein
MQLIALAVTPPNKILSTPFGVIVTVINCGEL